MISKLLSLSDAIARYVPDGSSVALGMALEAAIPFAAGHEIIRQGKRDLTLIAPISDILFDQLIGAGCVATVMAAWVGNVNTGSAYAFRRAVEQRQPREIEVRDHSNFTLALALTAASLGVPFIPTQSVLGSDLSSTNTDLIERINPLNERGEPLLLVRAIHPDVALIHVQRAEPGGGAHLWGNLGLCREAALAARAVILIAEEIVSPEVIRSDPNRVLLPPFRVSAIVHAPGGAHPAPVQGYYNRDHAFFDEYADASRTHEGLLDWLDAWVHNANDRADYLGRLGKARWQGRQAQQPALAAAVNYGV
ncbi:MAG: CoA transferase subunit A [Ardenticatenales bacterium]|nr:CoA transferase subunit A [Ardenticatenales bacterium]